MTIGVHVLPAGVQDPTGSPASAKQSANTRVKTAAGTISVLSDVLTFSGTFTSGNFIIPMQRVTIGGVPAINGATAGQAISSAGPPGPITVTQTDGRVSGQ